MTERSVWVVVGAGSAGCVVASRLSEDPERTVVLVEAGPDLRPGEVPPGIASTDALAAVAVDGRTWPDLVATRVAGSAPSRYLRGRGVGGSSAINALVALRGSSAQYERWGWDDIDDMWQQCRIPEELAHPDELGPIDRALLSAEADAAPVPLTRRAGRRVSSAEAYLWPASDRPNLDVRAGSQVDRIQFVGRTASGVRLVDGSEVGADRVVLCAGALHSPAILLRSGVDTPGVGDGLQDHPSVPLTLRYRPDAAPAGGGLVAATVLQRGDLQVLPMNHLGGDHTGHGLLLIALMRPVGHSGTVRLASEDPTASPVVDFDLLSDPSDVERLRAGVRLGLAITRSDPFEEILDDVLIDAVGTPADTLTTDGEVDRWLSTVTGDYVHATGTCAMGAVVDADAAVVGYDGLHVCDASVFPSIPDVNTHLPVTMLAERLSTRWRTGGFDSTR